MLLPWASCTSIWRNLGMICSELNLFFALLSSLVPGQFSPSPWSNSTQSDQVLALVIVLQSFAPVYLSIRCNNTFLALTV
jgi:hypothetical protein